MYGLTAFMNPFSNTAPGRYGARRTTACLLVVCLNALVPTAALGWGEAGHRIISRLATARLSPETRRAVESLLDGRSIENVSLWADEVRRLPQYQWSAPLHYVNVPPEATGFDMARDCPPEGCVVSAILRFQAELRDPAADRPRRREALQFLVHFVMDVHQPLHVGRRSDRGGNDIRVRFEGRQIDLHALWDTGLIEYAGLGISEHVRRIEQLITPEASETWAGCLDPAAWATESFLLARDWAYRITPDEPAGSEYRERGLDICYRRMAQAGVRLAALLEKLFADPAPTSAPVAASMPASAPAAVPAGAAWDAAVGAGVPQAR